jgi:hypothetical protein
MVSIRVEAIVEARPEQVWAAIADVGAVHERLLPGRLSGARLEGDARVVTMLDGTEVRELIVAVDHHARRMAYAVLPGQRMALSHHHATFQVFDDGEQDRSRLVWITDVLPHALEAEVRARVERGVMEMKDAIEADPGGAARE